MTDKLILDNEPSKAGDDPETVRRIFETARLIQRDAIGASCNLSSDPRLAFLPSSELKPRTYFSLLADGNHAPIPSLDTTTLVGRRILGETDRRRFELHLGMSWLEGMVVTDQFEQAKPQAHAFILRPGALLILRVPTPVFPNEHGRILFNPRLTGHEVLEEITAIESRFPGRFEIRQ